MTENEVFYYYEGAILALNKYAWWKDGVKYVGCGNYTYGEAKHAIEGEREVALANKRNAAASG